MNRTPCVCNDDFGMHDKDTGVCTQRHCACLHFVPILSRQGSMKSQEIHRVAADEVHRRTKFEERRLQRVLE
jgi:hypothetical protein